MRGPAAVAGLVEHAYDRHLIDRRAGRAALV